MQIKDEEKNNYETFQDEICDIRKINHNSKSMMKVFLIERLFRENLIIFVVQLIAIFGVFSFSKLFNS